MSGYFSNLIVETEPKKIRKIFDQRVVRDKIIEIVLSNYSGDREIYVTLMIYLEEFIDFIRSKCDFAIKILKQGAHSGQIQNHFKNALEKYNKKPDNMFSKIEKKHYVIR